jgi:thioesterase domain-containing protein
LSAETLLADLRRRDIRVWADGGDLRVSAPPGTLTSELRVQLRQHKREILQFLASGQTLAAQERAIVPLQRTGTRAPIFGVPGHNGDVFCYRALAQALGVEQPFFGLQPPGLDGVGKPLRRVEDLAAYFATQIRAFQPQGPYVIVGFCAGGTVAFELAQQLQRSGAGVSFVALFGCPFPSYFRLPAQLWLRFLRQAKRARNALRALVRGDARRRFFADKLRDHNARRAAARATAHDAVLTRRRNMERVTLSAIRRYWPSRFPGRVCLFLAGKQWQRSGVAPLRWRSVAHHVEEYFGPEASLGHDMLRAHASAFAELFRRCRDQVETHGIEPAEATTPAARARRAVRATPLSA